MAKKHNHHHKNKNKKNKNNQQAESVDKSNNKNTNSSSNETSDETEPIITPPVREEPRAKKSRCSCCLVFFLLVALVASGFVGYLVYENKLDQLNEAATQSVEFLTNTKDQIILNSLDLYNSYFPSNENVKAVNNDYCYGEDCHKSDQVDDSKEDDQGEDSIINRPANTLEDSYFVNKKHDLDLEEIKHDQDEIVNEEIKNEENVENNDEDGQSENEIQTQQEQLEETNENNLEKYNKEEELFETSKKAIDDQIETSVFEENSELNEEKTEQNSEQNESEIQFEEKLDDEILNQNEELDLKLDQQETVPAEQLKTDESPKRAKKSKKIIQ